MLGEILRNWLPSVLQMVKPYFTPSDIEKGARWNIEIANELEASSIGILCLTRENLNSPWMMFEAGAISKAVGSTYVCPILFQVEKSDITGPLNQFQMTLFNKGEMKRLIDTINAKLEEHSLSDDKCDSAFEKWWPELWKNVNDILDGYKVDKQKDVRKDREILDEILILTRLIARQQTEAIEKKPSENSALTGDYILRKIDSKSAADDRKELLKKEEALLQALTKLEEELKCELEKKHRPTKITKRKENNT